MKKTYMLKYFISFFAIISYLNCSSQEQNIDSIYKSTYGIKLGIDFSKQIRMLTEPEYKGIVIIGDYRVLDKFYIARHGLNKPSINVVFFINFTGHHPFSFHQLKAKSCIA